jgi:hypothetical protein
MQSGQAEIWAPCPRASRYLVSNMGKVRRTDNGYHPAQRPNLKGHLRVQLACDDGIRRKMYVHRLVALAHIPNPDFKTQVDHVHGDVTDNRACALRWATHAENMRNSRRPRHNTSGFKGVYFEKARCKWRADISVDGRRRNLGLFDTVEAAGRAYDEASRRLHGEFSRTNEDLGSYSDDSEATITDYDSDSSIADDPEFP